MDAIQSVSETAFGASSAQTAVALFALAATALSHSTQGAQLVPSAPHSIAHSVAHEPQAAARPKRRLLLRDVVKTMTITTSVPDEDDGSDSDININADFLFDPSNAVGTGPYFAANGIDAATQITSAGMMGGACIFVFSWIRYKFPELFSHRLRLRHMRPANIPRTMFGWIYPMVTMSDRHVFETVGLDAVLYYRFYRTMIYMFACMTFFGMTVLYPTNYFWSREEGDSTRYSVFESPLAHVKSLRGRYSIPHALMAWVFAAIIFFYLDRFALHAVTMRWHYLLLTIRAGNSRTLMVTHLPRELRSERALLRFVGGLGMGKVDAVNVVPSSLDLDKALAARAKAVASLEHAYAQVLGNPCRAKTYDPALLKQVVLADGPEARAAEEKLLRRWVQRRKSGKRKIKACRPRVLVRRTREERPEWGAVRRALWPYERVDAITHWRQELAAADARLQELRDGFHSLEASTVAFVTMQSPVDAYVLAQVAVHASPSTLKMRMAPEARSIVWANVGKPYSKKLLRSLLGFVYTVALLCLWCVPVVLISTLISLKFLASKSESLAREVEKSKFVRSLLGYTLPSLILTIFMTILPRLIWNFMLTGGDRTFAVADRNMLMRHFYFLVIYIVFIFSISGPVWSSVYDLFTDIGGFWDRMVNALPQVSTWYCVYVMLYGAGYQVMKLLHLKSVCRFLWHQARARTPRDYMKAISPVFIDWGTIQAYPMLFFFIGVLYSHLQPLLLAMCMLYFIVGLLVMKYMCTYSWYFRQQNAGSLWPHVLRRFVVCVIIYQALTTAVFSSHDNHWFVAPMVVLMLFSAFYFWVRCRYIDRLSNNIPLQLLREAQRRRSAQLAREARDAARTTQQQQQQPAVSMPASPLSAPPNPLWAGERSPRSSGEHESRLRISSALRRSDAGSRSKSRSVSPFARGYASDASAQSASPLGTRMAEPARPDSPLVDAQLEPVREGTEKSLDGNRVQSNEEKEALMVKRTHAKRTHTWYKITLSSAFRHPITALIRSVSFVATWLQGDPAAPLWEFIDDYAFPERVDRAARPAGRSPLDATIPKEQPRSLFEILRASATNLPKGMRSLAREFFLDFEIPHARLDSSIYDYPVADSTDDAFVVRRKAKRTKSDRYVARDLHKEQEVVTAQRYMPLLAQVDERLAKVDTRDSLGFSLAPRAVPESQVVCLHDDEYLHTPTSTTTPATRQSSPPLPAAAPSRSIPRINPYTGKPVAMQYQIYSDELPFGTHMNRKYTDFSQPNMSRLAGVLDSTRFSYLHPGVYGDLPSLWLPVAHLKRRQKTKLKMRDRLRRGVEAIGDTVENNIVGEDFVDRTRERMRTRRARKNTRASETTVQHPRIAALNAKGGKSELPALEITPSVESSVESSVDEEMVQRCAFFGISPRAIKRCDPTGLHSCYLRDPNANIGPERSSSLAPSSDRGYESDALSTLDAGLSDSESDNLEDDDEQSLNAV